MLIDVVRRKSRVRLFSAADRALAGRRRVVRRRAGRQALQAAPQRNLPVTLQGAKTRQVATFRFRTKVRFRVGNPHLFRTFTLPKYVDIG